MKRTITICALAIAMLGCTQKAPEIQDSQEMTYLLSLSDIKSIYQHAYSMGGLSYKRATSSEEFFTIRDEHTEAYISMWSRLDTDDCLGDNDPYWEETK